MNVPAVVDNHAPVTVGDELADDVAAGFDIAKAMENSAADTDRASNLAPQKPQSGFVKATEIN